MAGAGKARSISVAVLLLAAAGAAGCAAPPAQPGLEQQGLERPPAEPTEFVLLDGSGPAGVPAGPMPEETSSFVGAAEAPAQLVAARERFQEKLPEGIPWATDPYAWEPERDAAIEDGVFDSMVAGYWLCAWMGDYLQAQETGDRQRGESAVKELEKYATLPSTIASHQDPQAFASHVIYPAAGGDAAMLREFFGSSCSGYQRAVDSSADR